MHSVNLDILQQHIRTIPDFPKPGIQFKDITPLLQSPAAFGEIMTHLIDRYRDKNYTHIAGIESRGFIFAAPLAYALGLSFTPIRKKGKLPAPTHEVSYSLEYGSSTLEIHQDAFSNTAQAHVLLMDDLIATGGSASAACQLIERAGGACEEAWFAIALDALGGSDTLSVPAFSLLAY